MQVSRDGKYTLFVDCPINCDLQYQKCVPNLSFVCIGFQILATGLCHLPVTLPESFSNWYFLSMKVFTNLIKSLLHMLFE